MSHNSHPNAAAPAGGDTTIAITLLSVTSGESESLSLSPTTTTVAQVLELAQALLSNVLPGSLLFRDGQVLANHATLQQAGVVAGDMLVVEPPPPPIQRPAAAPPVPSVIGGGGLDFSSLLSSTSPTATGAAAAASGGGGFLGGLDFSSLFGAVSPSTTPAALSPATATGTAPTAAAAAPASFVYYPNMNLDEAVTYNPHPRAIVALLMEKEHLWKELHHHSPRLALALRQAMAGSPSSSSGEPPEAAIKVWQQHMVQGSIQKAVAQTTQYHREREMRQRLERDPNDAEAKAYFRQHEMRQLVQEQFQQMMQEYPESLSKVLMLYVPAKINGHTIQAFCDSGAQATIMSKQLATQCGLLEMVDDRFQGIATGVGTSKILGRIHLVELQLTSSAATGTKTYFFPCTVTVMDDPPPGAKEMPFLLGLDMMKRHLCQLDLEHGVLRFRIAPGDYLEVPFLHEKDLDETQGGTRGFDADRANMEWMKEDDDDHEKKEKNRNVNGDNTNKTGDGSK